MFSVAVLLLLGLLVLALRKPKQGGSAARSDGSVTITEDGQKIININQPGKEGPRLSVTSQPGGASVLLNGRLIGATPVSVDGLPLGVYGLRLEKDGCAPVSRSVEVKKEGVEVSEKLSAVPAGSLRVDIKPEGAEILLDGSLLGHTPLSVDNIPAGPYELLIRKTNFEAYSDRIEVTSDQPLVYSGFELKDKVFDMLDRAIKAEPQRLAHYIDLGHYLFVNDRMKESVDVFLQGMEMAQTTLDFNGPGYTGAQNMSEDEKALETRLRREDESRFLKEIEKHRSWPRKDTRTFRAELEQGQELLGRRNAASWAWAQRSGGMQMHARNYGSAIKIYRDHIAAAPNSPDLYRAYTAVIEACVGQRDLGTARKEFDQFFTRYAADGAALRYCGAQLYSWQDRMNRSSRAELLAMCEQALRRGLELAKPDEKREKAQCMDDLAAVLLYLDKPKESVPLLEQAIDLTPEASVREERSLRLADALRRSDRLEEAAAIYKKLSGSDQSRIRESAKTGLIYVEIGRKKPRR